MSSTCRLRNGHPNRATMADSWVLLACQDAERVLREMPTALRTLKAAHDIIRHCVDAKRMQQATALLDDFESLGLEWSHGTWYLATCLKVLHSLRA